MKYDLNKINSVLSKTFGYDSFRLGQEDIVKAILSEKDVLCIMPTGGGKSICYQVPALILEGITIVVSPLISLMKDQVTALNQSGVSAVYINSTLTASIYHKVISDIASGKVKIIYVAPERLLNNSFLEVISGLSVELVAVDEAHCVSQWGQDFRPGYMNISSFIKELPKRPIIAAFTATATKDVSDDIKRLLLLQDPITVTTGFDRPNLRFSVCTPKDRKAAVLDYVTSNRDKSGVIYAATRKSVEEICGLLIENGINATRYHAGLDMEERAHNQELFIRDEIPVMVATNAFGMGIDKSNVSYVLHYNMPKNLESYYQEAGRAGRDGQKGQCMLFYHPSDIRTNRYFIENSEPPAEMSDEEIAVFKEQEYNRLKFMTFYATTDRCLRTFILQYFGERSKGDCGNCSGCDGGMIERDVTIESQKIMSCIVRCKESHGAARIIEVLKGAKTAKVLELGFDKLSTYGLLKDQKSEDISRVINLLRVNSYIDMTDGEYPILKVTEKGWLVLKSQQKVTMRVSDSTHREMTVRDAKVEKDDPLLARLKSERLAISKIESVPAYVIFSDATLIDICKKRPKTMSEMLSVSGVGSVKLEKYGARFIRIVQDFVDKQ